MPAQTKQHLSNSPDTSYVTRDNIAVPTTTLGRSAATVLANANSRINDTLRSTVDTDVAVSNEDTPAAVTG